MPSDFSNKTIVVTGANGIIGREVCQKALYNDANVAAFDWTFENLETLKAQLSEEHKERLLLIPCDLREKAQIKAGLHQILTKWKSIEALHNNAAWKTSNVRDFFVPFEDYALETWREILAVNLDGAMLVDQVIGHHMANIQGWGAIAHTASIYGLVGPDQRIYEGSKYMGGPINTPAVYSASKGALISLTYYLATYWGNKGIRVNCITPGGVESGQNETFLQQYSQKVPLGRMAKAGEIADAVLFLLSDKASYINGHNLVIDGGFTIW
jgi:NAD(P)-dependent dehydrogenase (short-subunit alcohol dehydrogenase family)